MATEKHPATEQDMEQDMEQAEQEAQAEQAGSAAAEVEAAVEQEVSQSTYATFVRDLYDAMGEVRKSTNLLQASDFEPVLVPLRDGAAVEIRPTDLKSLVFSGLIPEPLLPVAIKAAEGAYSVHLTDEDTAGMSLSEIREEEVKQQRHMTETLNIMVAAVVAKPRFVATLEEVEKAREAGIGESDVPIWAGQLQQSDKIDILNYAQAPVVAFRRFR